MSSVTNIQNKNDSAEDTKLLFDRFFSNPISYPSNQVDAVVGFFIKRGFEKTAAFSVASVLLQQAKTDNVNVFELLDTLEGFDKVKLSNLVLVVLNQNRSKISKIGYRKTQDGNYFEARNIIDLDLATATQQQTVESKNFSSSTTRFDISTVTWDGV